MSDGATTDRAQRQQAVASGQRDTAIDRVETADPSAGVGRGSSQRRQQQSASELAAELGVPESEIARQDQIGGGVDLSLRSGGVDDFAQTVRGQFASDADFVSASDVAANIDRQDIAANPVVAQDRRDDVAQRAEASAAEDAQFVRATDLEADVGARGVTGLAIPEPRRDDVAQRAEQSLASSSEFIRPSDVDADVTDSGVSDVGLIGSRQDDVAGRVREDIASESRFIRTGDVAVSVTAQGVESAGLSDAGEDRVESRQEAARREARQEARQEAREELATELDSEYGGVDIGTGDISISGGSATLNTGVQKEIAAEQISDELTNETDATFDINAGQIRETDDGFGLSGRVATLATRARAAAEIDDEITDANIGITNVGETSDGSFGLTDTAETRVAASRINDEIGGVFIGPRSVNETSDGSFGLSDYGQRRVAAADIEDQIEDEVGADVTADDVTATDDGGFELTEEFKEEL